MGYWYNRDYGKENIAVSTRIRLARNLSSIPFSSKMNAEQKSNLQKTVRDAVSGSKSNVISQLKFINMSDVPENERFALFERHIISKEFATNPQNRSILISADESVSIMIGEEDHIRIQVIKGGFCPEDALRIANEIDDELSKKLPIAFDSKLGYLTECPTNIGTGLRASVMLHLPFITANNKISGLIESLNKIGYTIRGMYGEGSKSVSNLYQVSNQITLGITEKDAVETLKQITNQIINSEIRFRKGLNNIQIEDKVSRAVYTLKGAKILNTNEMSNLLNDIMVGVNLGLIKEDTINPIKTLIECGPFMLMSKFGEKSPMERDVLRAKVVSESINL